MLGVKQFGNFIFRIALLTCWKLSQGSVSVHDGPEMAGRYLCGVLSESHAEKKDRLCAASHTPLVAHAACSALARPKAVTSRVGTLEGRDRVAELWAVTWGGLGSLMHNQRPQSRCRLLAFGVFPHFVNLQTFSLTVWPLVQMNVKEALKTWLLILHWG